MSSFSDGACKLHSRPASSTCKRCGGFLCDWCEKLAPSWGPGYCNECLNFITPDTAHLGRMPFGSMFVVALLLVLSMFSFYGVSRELHRPVVDLGGIIWSGAIGVGLLLAVGVIFAMNWRKR